MKAMMFCMFDKNDTRQNLVKSSKMSHGLENGLAKSLFGLVNGMDKDLAVGLDNGRA